MKTYYRDYSLEGIEGAELEEVINNRQEKFSFTTKYQGVKIEIRETLKKIKTLLPEEQKKSVQDLDETIVYLENLSYSAAYRDGMTDLMTAMTLNKLQITKSEYPNLSDDDQIA